MITLCHAYRGGEQGLWERYDNSRSSKLSRFGALGGWKILASYSFLRSVVGSKMASSTEQQRSWQ